MLLKGFMQVTKTLARMEKAESTWNLQLFEQCKSELEEKMKNLAGWNKDVDQVAAAMEERRAEIRSEDYGKKVEEALRRAGLPVEGAFPSFSIPPLVLNVSPEQCVARLVAGRRSEKTGVLEPRALAAWVARRHESVVKRPFSARRFFRNLLHAYQLANRLEYGKDRGNDTVWGMAVGLKEIYRILTLREEARAEYPEAHFCYDLSRLRASGLTYDRHVLEFGFSRSARGSFLVRDLVTGREDRFSTLTVYLREA